MDLLVDPTYRMRYAATHITWSTARHHALSYRLPTTGPIVSPENEMHYAMYARKPKFMIQAAKQKAFDHAYENMICLHVLLLATGMLRLLLQLIFG